MTDITPVTQIVPDYGRRPPAHSIGVVLSWLTILGVVTFVAARNWMESHSARLEQAADEVSMQMAARSAVGLRAISGDQKAGGLLGTNQHQLINEVISQARSPGERLHAVPVIGELQGAAAALDELDRISPSLDSQEQRLDARSLRTIYLDGPHSLSPQARQDLLVHMGWFGRLALSYDQPVSTDSRRQIISNGIRALIATFTVEATILLTMLAGIALLTLTIVRVIDAKLSRAYGAPENVAGIFLESFAIYLAGFVGIGWLLRHFHSERAWVDYGLELVWVGFACLWPLLRGASFFQLRQGLGWHRGKGIFREAIAGIAGYITGMPLLALATYLTIVLIKFSGERAVHPIVFGGGRHGAAAIIGLYLLASVWAPVVEETMFRGALFNYLRSRHRWLFSAALSAIIFAALHPQGWAAMPVLATIGFVFAGIREWRGSFIASAAAHALNNAVAVTMLILVLG